MMDFDWQMMTGSYTQRKIDAGFYDTNGGFYAENDGFYAGTDGFVL